MSCLNGVATFRGEHHPQSMGVWIKEVDYEVRIHQLTGEIDSMKQELLALGYTPQKPLVHEDFNQFL